MKLVNVRLTAEDAHVLDELRQEGVSISEVMREAIRSKAQQFRQRKAERPTAEIIKEIFARNPEPEDEYEITMKSKDPAALSDVMHAMAEADYRRIVNDNLSRHKRAAGSGSRRRPASPKGRQGLEPAPKK